MISEARVAVLLALANGHDQRHGTDDVKVRAWFALLSQEAPDLDQDWAVQRINEHYARSTDMLMPAHLVSAWRNHKSYQRSRALARQPVGTPMPEWFKRQVQDLKRRHD